MSDWIWTGDQYPSDDDYVLGKFEDGFIGIFRFIKDEEWDVRRSFKRPIFKGKERFMTSGEPQYWKRLDETQQDMADPSENDQRS